MSPSNINSFVGDLVQMAKAMETLPLVEAENERLSNAVEDYAKQVQALELRAIDRNAEINSLHDRIRSLEVERDDASFRVLEAEDREHTVLAMARSIASAVGNVINTLDPPKPQPVTEPKSEQTSMTSSANEVVTSGESVSPPTPASMEASSPVASNVETQATASIEPSSGQSENHPTAHTGQVEMDAGASPATSTDVGSTIAGTSSADQEPTHGPYFGKQYRNVEGYVSYHDWIQGGGTHNDYCLPF